MKEGKTFEDVLRRSDETYRVLFEKNPYPLWMYDAETLHILAMNAAAMRKYGYAPDEIPRLTFADLYVPEDVPNLLQHASSPHPELVVDLLGDAGLLLLPHRL